MSQADYPNSTNAAEVSLTRKGERYAATHDPNAEYFAALARLRKEAMAEIDRLLAFLDDVDSDVDVEDGADEEPSSDRRKGGERTSRPRATIASRTRRTTRTMATANLG